MADQIKTVTDKSQFEMLFNKFYKDHNVFIKAKSGDIHLQYLGYSNDKVAFRILHVKSIPEQVVVFSRDKNNNTIYASLRFSERNEDTFIFVPVKFQIIFAARKEDRSIVGGSSSNILYVNNVVSDFIMKNELSMNLKKIDKIKETVHFDMEKQFPNIVITLINESTSSPRMKHFLAHKKEIILNNFNGTIPEEEKESFNYYINNIYAKDYKLTSKKKYISEISVPILYKNFIPYGYIQVNDIKPFTDGSLTIVRRMAIVIDELFKNSRMFLPFQGKFLVSDLSEKGMGLVFKEKRLARHFSKGSLIYSEILLPTQKKAFIGSVVRNVAFLENGVIKVGLENMKLDETSTGNYEEFLKIIHKDKNS